MVLSINSTLFDFDERRADVEKSTLRSLLDNFTQLRSVVKKIKKLKVSTEDILVLWHELSKPPPLSYDKFSLGDMDTNYSYVLFSVHKQVCNLFVSLAEIAN